MVAIHAKMPAEQAADRLAIRELFDAYAHCADRRDAKRQMALFTPDTRFLVVRRARAHGRLDRNPPSQPVTINTIRQEAVRL
jgi:ketosteroid isomerase-like protein